VYVGKCEKCERQLMAAEPGYRIFVNIWKIGRWSAGERAELEI
jgi:hypothetical protein